MMDPDWQGSTMTRSVRKRTSKWDMTAETPVLAETGQDTALPIKPDDYCEGKDSNTDWKFSRYDSQLSKCPEPRDERTSKDWLEESQSLNQTNEETDRKEGSKMPSCEPFSGIQSTVKDGDVRRTTNSLGTTTDLTYNQSMSPGLDTRRQHSHSISPRIGWSRPRRSRSWSRSPKRSRSSRSRSWSRSRSRSRSRSPSYGSKHGSDRWAARGRMVMGGSAAPCRDFAAGRCRRGNQCRYLHDDGRRKHDRHFDIRREMVGNNRFDRGRCSEDDRRENAESWVQRGYPRDKVTNRHKNHYDGNLENTELHRSSRSTERCYDFTKGRCHRGSTCRYVHHDASSDGGRYMQDETREKTHERKEADRSFGQGLERQRASDTPCKFFAEGGCSRGDQCRFSHWGMPHGNSEGREPGDRHGFGYTDKGSWSGQNRDGHTPATDGSNSSQWMGKDNIARVAAHQSMDGDHSEQEPQLPRLQNAEHNQHEILPQQAPQGVLPSQEKNVSQEASGQHQQGIGGDTSQEVGSAIANSAISKPEMNFASKVPPLAPIPGRNFGQDVQNQRIVPQPPHAQGFPPNLPTQQAFPVASGGQMQQVVYSQPPNWQGQFIGLQAPLNTQKFNLNVQPVLPSPHTGQSQQNCNLDGQLQQNFPQFGHSQQMFNLTGPTQQGIPHNGQGQLNSNPVGQVQESLPHHTGQNQENLNPTGQIQHDIPPNGQNLQDFNISNQGQQSLPPVQNGESQQIVPSLVPNRPNQPGATQPLTHTRIFNSDEQDHQNGGDELPQLASDSSTITQKVITSEQAAQITNLSASLAQFFANGPQLPQLYATLNPLAASGMPSQQPLLKPTSVRPPAPTAPLNKSNQGSLTRQQLDDGSDSMEPPGFSSMLVEQKNLQMEEAQATSKSLAPLVISGTAHGSSIKSGGLDERLCDGSSEAKQLELNGDTESKVNETETAQSKKEQTAQSEDVDAEVRTDGESKRSKDAKGIRMFKSALVEFVKDILKPIWKEGQLSKEAHKTIVKKVVEKVTSAMQGANIPQTPEKIDIYLSHSKTKLTKLVQAYVEKYVKG